MGGNKLYTEVAFVGYVVHKLFVWDLGVWYLYRSWVAVKRGSTVSIFCCRGICTANPASTCRKNTPCFFGQIGPEINH